MNYKRLSNFSNNKNQRKFLIGKNLDDELISIPDLDPEYCDPDDPLILQDEYSTTINRIAAMVIPQSGETVTYDFADIDSISHYLININKCFRREDFNTELIYSTQQVFIPFLSYIITKLQYKVQPDDYTKFINITLHIITSLFYRDLTPEMLFLLNDLNTLFINSFSKPDIQVACFNCFYNALLDQRSCDFFVSPDIIKSIIEVIQKTNSYDVKINGFNFLETFAQQCTRTDFGEKVSGEILLSLLQLAINSTYSLLHEFIGDTQTRFDFLKSAVSLLITLTRQENLFIYSIQKFDLEGITKELMLNFKKFNLGIPKEILISHIFELVGNISSYLGNESRLINDPYFFECFSNLYFEADMNTKNTALHCLHFLTRNFSIQICEHRIFDNILNEVDTYSFENSRLTALLYLNMLSNVSIQTRKEITNDMALNLIVRILENEDEDDIRITSETLLMLIRDDEEFWLPLCQNLFGEFYQNFVSNEICCEPITQELYNCLFSE